MAWQMACQSERRSPSAVSHIRSVSEVAQHTIFFVSQCQLIRSFPSHEFPNVCRELRLHHFLRRHVLVQINNFHRPMLLLAWRPCTNILTELSPSFCWFATSLSALIKVSQTPCGAPCSKNVCFSPVRAVLYDQDSETNFLCPLWSHAFQARRSFDTFHICWAQHVCLQFSHFHPDVLPFSCQVVFHLSNDDTVSRSPGVNDVQLWVWYRVDQLHLVDHNWWIRWWSKNVAVCRKGVSSCGGGALLLIHSGTAFKGELCGVGLFLTGDPSIFISVSRSKATLASRFLKGERVCGSTNSQPESEKTTSQSTFASEKGTITTSTTGGEAGRHREKPKEFPTRSTSEKGQRNSNTLVDKRTGQIHSLLKSNRSRFSSTSLFLLLLSSSLASLFILLLYLPHPPEKVFLVHGSVFTEQVSVFSGQGSSVFQLSICGEFPYLFLRHETSHLKLFPKPFALVPGDTSLPFEFSILSHSWQGPSSLRMLRLVLTCFHTLSCPFSPVCIDSSIWVTCCAAKTFCTKLRPLHVGHTLSPCRPLPNAMCSIFPACVWSLIATLVHHMFLVFSCCCCFFRISCTDVRLLPHTTPFDDSLLHLFCCQKPTTLIPFVLNRDRDCSHLRHISSVQPRSLLCKLICFLMAFSDELLEKLHFPAFPYWSDVLWRVRLPPVRLLDELCGTSPKSRSTSRRPSLLGQCTSFLLSTARQQCLSRQRAPSQDW